MSEMLYQRGTTSGDIWDDSELIAAWNAQLAARKNSEAPGSKALDYVQGADEDEGQEEEQLSGGDDDESSVEDDMAQQVAWDVGGGNTVGEDEKKNEQQVREDDPVEALAAKRPRKEEHEGSSKAQQQQQLPADGAGPVPAVAVPVWLLESAKKGGAPEADVRKVLAAWYRAGYWAGQCDALASK